jgi:hypothetical protein
MLQKDIERAMRCFDNFFGNFDYPDIPTHYEEMLIIYQNMIQAGNEFYVQYPVSHATIERFNRYMQTLQTARSSRRNFENFE